MGTNKKTLEIKSTVKDTQSAIADVYSVVAEPLTIDVDSKELNFDIDSKPVNPPHIKDTIYTTRLTEKTAVENQQTPAGKQEEPDSKHANTLIKNGDYISKSISWITGGGIRIINCDIFSS